MKKSNIIISCSLFIAIGWLLVSGWLQAEAYKTISAGNSSSYANLRDARNVSKLPAFKNIKIDFGNVVIPFSIHVQYGKRQEVSCPDNIKKAISYKVISDTLYVSIKNVIYEFENSLIIIVPQLNSVKLSTPEPKPGWSSDVTFTTISGFTSNNLSIINNCPYNLRVESNSIKKLTMKGDDKFGKTEISNCLDYDSLDIDIQTNKGKLILGKYGSIKPNPNQYWSIKTTRDFKIEADVETFMMCKFSLKK
jgi:hypothetical protein